MRRLALALVACCGLGLLYASPSPATTYTVNSTADLPASGPLNDSVCDADPDPATFTCTLRAAVQEANGLISTDVINLPDLGATYVLDQLGTDEDDAASGDLDIRRNLTLQGSGRPLIDATGLMDRVLQIGPAPTTPTVTISGVELTGGGGVDRGGGILIDGGAVTLSEITVSGNVLSAGAVAEGAGIWAQGGSHTLSRSTVDSNQASGLTGARGGGIGVAAGAALGITNSTISANSANAPTDAEGGGLWSAGTISLTYATMSENGAGADGEGGLVFTDAGSVFFRGTILDHGQASAGTENCESGGGSLGTSGANLEALDLGLGVQCGLSPAAGDLFAVDGGVAPLAERGGPTRTHALFNGSPALDAVPSCFPLTIDQRGQPRPGAFACDVGSYERQVLAPSGETCFGRQPTIVGFSKSEKIIGTPGDDVIIAKGGDDRILAREGDDRICAGKGKDRVFGGAGDDRIAGEESRDRLFGQGGNDLLRGGSGKDYLDGGKGRDRLDGGRGRDRCRSGASDKRKSC